MMVFFRQAHCRKKTTTVQDGQRAGTSLAAWKTQQIIRFFTVRFGLEILPAITGGYDDPDRLSVCYGPKSPLAVLDAFDGHIELNAPSSPGILRTFGPADTIDPAVGIGPVRNDAGDLMILRHAMFSFVSGGPPQLLRNDVPEEGDRALDTFLDRYELGMSEATG